MENCSDEVRAKLAISRANGVSMHEIFASAQVEMLFDERAELIAAGKLQAGQQVMPFPQQPEASLRERLEQIIVRAPTINPNVGYGLMAGGAALVTLGAAGAVMGLGATAAVTAETTAPVVLTVIEGGGAVVARTVASEEIRRAAGIAALTIAAGSSAAAAEPVEKYTAENLLPPLAGMNAGTDAMGDRQQVDHISWRFTRLPVGDSGNSLSALALRDRENQLGSLGAHAVLRADGSFERSDSLCRDWANNPQIQAGRNGNAIGLYVEGDGALTAAQRQSLGKLETGFSSLCQSHQAQAGELSPATQLEAEAWSGPRSVTPGMVMQAPVRQMRIAGMGQ